MFTHAVSINSLQCPISCAALTVNQIYVKLVYAGHGKWIYLFIADSLPFHMKKFALAQENNISKVHIRKSE
jgi:hypothetical protein